MAETPTFADKVNELVAKATENEKGALILDDSVLANVPEELAYAAKTELRYRNTQKGFTKASQESKRLSKINEQLTNHLTETVTLHLTKEQKAELETLKTTNPDAWREKMNEHEKNARETLQSKLTEFAKEGEKLTELEIRQAKLASFIETTGIELNDDVIANQLPAKLSKDLESGAIDFDTFLTKAHQFLTKAKVIAGTQKEELDDTDFNKLPGGSKASEQAIKGDVIQKYSKAVF